MEAGRLHHPRERRRLGLTLLEGPHVVEEAMAAGVEIRSLFALADDRRLPDWPAPTLVEETVMRKLAGTETPRGPVAVASIPPWVEPVADHHLLWLWELADPGNVGTIIRTAAAFGLGVAVSPGGADPWSPKSLRAGAGGHFRLPSLSQVAAADELPDHRLAAAVVEGGTPPQELGSGPWAVILGSEAHGIDPDLAGKADARVTIPMPGRTESLNVSVAAGIIAYRLSGAAGPHH